MFADASEEAVGYGMYVQSRSENFSIHDEIFGSESSTAPKDTKTVPRLELCAALEAVQKAFRAA